MKQQLVNDNVKVSSTVIPTDRPDFNSWTKMFKVSSRHKTQYQPNDNVIDLQREYNYQTSYIRDILKKF